MYEQLKLENQLCFRFYTVSRLITQAYRPLLGRLGVTYPQYLVLLVLWEQDGQPVNDIAKRLYLETNTMTPLLKRMEQEGIVTRHAGEQDSRKVIVSLTEKGRSLEDLARDIPLEMGASYTCRDISPDKLGELYRQLDSLTETFKTSANKQ